MRKCTLCISVLFFVVTFTVIDSGITQDKNVPKGFAFYNPKEFKIYHNFHGGAGTIKYAEYFGPDDYNTLHQFIRVVVIPAKCSIGEYRLVDSDELIVILSGHIFVTVNGRTGRLVGGTMVPIKMGDTLGMYNPTEEDVSLVWLATAAEKGKYNPVDLNNDLSGKRSEGIIPFQWIYQNYWIPPEPSGRPSHEGVGSLKSAFGRVDFDYFNTKWTASFMVVPVGASIGYHKHYTNEEHYFIVKGQGRVTVDDVTMPQKPGDCTFCGVNSSHGIYNNGSEDIVVFFTNLPQQGVENWGRVENLGDDLTNR